MHSYSEAASGTREDYVCVNLSLSWRIHKVKGFTVSHLSNLYAKTLYG